MMRFQNRQAAIGFIFVTLLIDIIGWGIIIPVIPKLLEELAHVNVSQASQIGGWLTFAYAITQFFFAPIIGNLSDRYGRRPVILFSLLGFAIDYLFLAFAPTVFWLFIGRIVAGITGASITTVSAYIADISTNENRAKNFGMIGAAFGLGFIVGPVIGGLLGQYGARVPFYAAAVLCLLNFLYGYFILPESLDTAHRRKFDIRRANPIGSLLQIRKYPALGGLILSLTFIYIAAHAIQSNWSFFTMYRFGWDEKMVGISLGVVGLLIGLVQGLLIRYTSSRLGNKKSIIIGLVLYTVGMFLFAFAKTGWEMMVILVPYCLGGIAGPSLQSVISANVSPKEQGELQGALTSLMSATSIIGPPLMTGLFYYATKKGSAFHLPGSPFLLAGLLLAISTIIAYNNLKGRRDPQQAIAPEAMQAMEIATNTEA